VQKIRFRYIQTNRMQVYSKKECDHSKQLKKCVNYS